MQFVQTIPPLPFKHSPQVVDHYQGFVSPSPPSRSPVFLDARVLAGLHLSTFDTGYLNPHLVILLP